MALHLADLMEARKCPYEALDSSAMPVRDAKRRGMDGWPAPPTSAGPTAWAGTKVSALLVAVNPAGVITGFGFALRQHRPAAGGDLLRRRAMPEPQAHRAWARPSSGPYVTDKGFEGAENHRRWLDLYGAGVICPPKRNAREVWPKRLRRWVAGIRQIIESVYDKLFNTFGLWRERPHELGGLRARLAARVALHNFCIWLNEQLGRPRLAFADLLGW